MKIFAYSVRADEAKYFNEFSGIYGVELGVSPEKPTMENAGLAKGYDCISVVTTEISAELVEKFHDEGIKFISTRTIGYEHIDLKKAEELGMHAGNATYSPSSVAEYAVMLILMAIRKTKLILARSSAQDYDLKGFRGRELHNLTVGVMGTGKIGQTVIKNLSGFDCEILAFDLYEKEEVKKYAKYVDLDTLYRESDVITLHIPATDENYHIIDKESIAKMKDGVFIVNTARGSLLSSKDLIDGIIEKKIGGAALDVVENDMNIYYSEKKGQIIDHKELAILRSFPNVTLTPHTAFYTDQAVSDMVEFSIKSCVLFIEGKENPWQVL
ncbi:D-isomer specific 2-hydroxyacid dehydrogenase family protein [Clostridium sp. DL1XJH146]